MNSMINKEFNYAIVGASNNTEKYGYKVLKDLKESDYKVIPINLMEEKILGLKVYSNLSKVIEKIDVVIFLVPPKIVEKVLLEVRKLKIKNVWMQEGSESENAINYCKENNINCVYNKCIMIERKN